MVKNIRRFKERLSVKKGVKFWIIAIISVTMVASLFGCGNREKEAESTNQINISLATDPGTLDPTINNQFYAVNMLNHLYEGLMKWEKAGDGSVTLVEGQAASYEVSDNKLIYTFKIRSDAEWSDGQKVTADDFVYAWDRAVADETGASYAYMLKDLNASWEAVDKETFRVTLSAPCSYFLEICAFPVAFPVRKDIIEEKGDTWSLSPETIVCNGKYNLDEYEYGSYVTMKKNDDYYDSKMITAECLKFYFYDDANASLAAYKSGEIDFCQNYPSGETPALLEAGDLDVRDSLGVCYIAFNNEDEVFADERVREAFTLAIDRQYIVDKITQGGQVCAGGFVPNGIYDIDGSHENDFRTIGGNYYEPTDAGYLENCTRARELMKEAGYENGNGFPVVEFQCNFSKEFNEAIKYMWEDTLGVKVNIISEDSAVFLQRLQEGDYQVAFTACIANYNDPITILEIFTSNGSGNIINYSNEQYDELINSAKVVTDSQERINTLHTAEDILMSEYAVCPVYFISSTSLHSNLDGIYYCPLGYYFFDQCIKER